MRHEFGFLLTPHAFRLIAVSIYQRSHSRCALLIGDAEYVRCMDVHRSSQQFNQFWGRCDDSIDFGNFIFGAVAAVVNDGVDFGDVEQQRRLDSPVARHVGNHYGGFYTHDFQQRAVSAKSAWGKPPPYLVITAPSARRFHLAKFAAAWH